MRARLQFVVIVGLVTLLTTSGIFAADLDEDKRRLIVIGPRVLNDALIALESSLGCNIAFEDAPYESPKTIIELFPGGPKGPRTSKIDFEYSAKSPPLEIVESLLNQYNKEHDETVFKAVEDEGNKETLNVFPLRWKNSRDIFVKHKSLFATPVTFQTKDGDTLRSALQRILDSLTNPYEDRMSLWGPMSNIPLPAGLKISDKSARDCINELLRRYSTLPLAHKSFWSLRRGPYRPKLGRFAVFSVRRIDPVKSPANCRIRIMVEKPLAIALPILEEILDCTISYEDHEYMFWKHMMENKEKEPQRLSGGIIDFSFSRDADKAQVIRDIASQFKRVGIFEVSTLSENSYSVYPVKSYDVDGKLVQSNSLSKTVVDEPRGDGNVKERLNSYCRALGAKMERKITVGKISMTFASRKVTGRSSKRLFAEKLTDTLHAIDEKLSWQLTYSPKTREYTLNVYRVNAAVGH